MGWHLFFLSGGWLNAGTVILVGKCDDWDLNLERNENGGWMPSKKLGGDADRMTKLFDTKLVDYEIMLHLASHHQFLQLRELPLRKRVV